MGDTSPNHNSNSEYRTLHSTISGPFATVLGGRRSCGIGVLWLPPSTANGGV